MFEIYLFFGVSGMIVGFLWRILGRLDDILYTLEIIKKDRVFNTLFKGFLNKKLKDEDLEDEKDKSGTAA